MTSCNSYYPNLKVAGRLFALSLKISLWYCIFSTESNIEPTNPPEHNPDMSHSAETNEGDSLECRTPLPKAPRRSVQSSQKSTFESKLLQILENRKEPQEEDDDMAFFRSLLPGIRKLTDLQKTEFKLDVLNALQKQQRLNIPQVPPYIQPSVPYPSTYSHYQTPQTFASTYQSLNPPSATNHLHASTPLPSPSFSVDSSESRHSQFSETLDLYPSN